MNSNPPSPFRLTPYGEAVTKANVSPGTARRLLEILRNSQDLADTKDDLIRLSVRFLIRLADVPEQPSPELAHPTGRIPHPVGTHAELHQDIRKWLEAVPLHQAFATAPHRIRSKRTPSVTEWVNGQAESDHWDRLFDRYVDFIEQALATFLPHMLTASKHLSQYAGLSQRPYGTWALYLAHGVDSLTAAKIMEQGIAHERLTASAAGHVIDQDPNPGTLCHRLAATGLMDPEHARLIANWHTRQANP